MNDFNQAMMHEKARRTSNGLFLTKLSVLLPSLLVFGMSLLHPCQLQAELIDRIVGSVNNDVITLRELNQAVGFNTEFGARNNQNIRPQTLDGLINRRLLLQEASRLKFVEDVSRQDVDNEIDILKKRLGSDDAFADFLKRLDISLPQLSRMLGERLLVERFIEKKIGLFIRVGRDEALEYFNRNVVQFKGKKFQEVQKSITAALEEQKLDEQMTQYLSELKAKADIRVNL